MSFLKYSHIHLVHEFHLLRGCPLSALSGESFINPLTPMSDQARISPHNMNTILRR